MIKIALTKTVDPKRFFWNPETKEKVFTHHIFMDGRRYVKHEPIKLPEGDLKKAEAATAACVRQSNKEFESRTLRGKVKTSEERVGKRGKVKVD